MTRFRFQWWVLWRGFYTWTSLCTSRSRRLGLSLINMIIYHAEWREEEMSCIMGYQGLCAFGDWPRLKRNGAFHCTPTSNMEKCSWKALQVRNRTRCSYCKSSGFSFFVRVSTSHVQTGFLWTPVSIPCGEQDKRNILSKMQSQNPSAIVWRVIRFKKKKKKKCR